MIYIAVVITDNNGEFTFTVAGHSSDKKKVEEFADKQRKFLAPTQTIDIFESEEFK